MKKVIKRFIEIIIFMILLLAMFLKVSLFEKAYGKGLSYDRNIALFYELDDNTVDVLMVGDSHIYNSFIPQLIFDKSGISSAIVATSNQSIINSYWLIKQAINKQDIKLIVMDTHSIEDTLRKKDDYLHFTSGILALPDFSLNKYYCYKDLKQADYGISDTLTYYDVLGLLQFRNDYDRQISFKETINLLLNPQKQFYTFGYYPTTEVYKMEEYNIGSNYDVQAFDESISYKYLNKIMDLCKDKDIKLLLTRNLYDSTSANLYTYEQIFKWADNNNVEVIDYFKLINELGFDKDSDFCNKTHLNYNGAKKATTYLFEFIKNNYSLSDHRGENKYKLWEDNDFDYNLIEQQMKGSINKTKQ